jgi:hypothetical protein
MNLKSQLSDPCSTLRIGLFFLILANLSRWFARPGSGISQDWADGIMGLFYGLAFSLILLSLRRRGRGTSQHFTRD